MPAPADGPPAVDAVVFDVGGVFVDWNPRYLYRKLIPDEATMERFLSEVCTPAWHLQHDRGVDYAQSIPALVAGHPGWEPEIRAWAERFDEMYGGVFEDSVDLLETLHARGTRLIAATNWGAESWARIKRRHRFLERFDGALVSGEVGVVKPEPAFYRLLVETFALAPPRTLFVDDSPANVRAAAAHGFVAHRFGSAAGLRRVLAGHGLLPPVGPDP